jgi:hypothetical protein
MPFIDMIMEVRDILLGINTCNRFRRDGWPLTLLVTCVLPSSVSTANPPIPFSPAANCDIIAVAERPAVAAKRLTDSSRSLEHRLGSLDIDTALALNRLSPHLQ